MHTQTTNKDYRPDIDGLRALAIISVILYHINSNLLPGGFSGVDVFFVISGYLITSHLLYEISVKNDFSYKRFYLRRIRRILPALFFMILSVMVCGYFIFHNYYFQLLGEQAFAAALSYSNIYFYLTSGYFDLDSSLKPLLHTWSLGVEEQFYFVWPVILVIAHTYLKSMKYVFHIFIIMFIISFALNGIYFGDTDAIFYLMPFRVFEFAVGGFVARLVLAGGGGGLGGSSTLKEVSSMLGVTLVLAPMFYLKDGHVFPYYNAIPTTVGVGLLLYNRNSFVSYILSQKFIVFIGLISYSLYLYHWPVIVFAKYEFGVTDTKELLVTAIVLSFILATISYHLIERPFRFGRGILISSSFATLVVFILFISTASKSLLIESMHGGKDIISKTSGQANKERYTLLSQEGCDITTIETEKYCDWDSKNQILFLGNSHNLDGYNIFRTALGDNREYNLIFGGNTYLCQYQYRPDNILLSKNNRCTEGARKLLSEKLLSKIDVLVVNFFKIKTWGAEYLPIISAIRKINPNVKIVVIGSYIGVRPQNCRELVNKYGSIDVCKDVKYVTFWGGGEGQWVASQDFASMNYVYIDTIDLLCGKNRKLSDCVVNVGDELIFYDGDHFSLEGSRHIGELIFEKYGEKLSEFGLRK